MSNSNEVPKISVAINSLQTMDDRFDLRESSPLRALQEDLVQFVETLIQKGLHNFYSGISAGYQHAIHIELSKLAEPPMAIPNLVATCWLLRHRFRNPYRTGGCCNRYILIISRLAIIRLFVHTLMPILGFSKTSYWTSLS